MPSKGPCLYCGHHVRLTLEHLIPENMGGTQSKEFVCASCNNTVVSRLDDELGTKSPLSFVAAFELRKAMKYSWDIDHNDNRLLLEAVADERTRSMTIWPQLIFDEDGAQLRGDAEEIQSFGWSRFQQVFLHQMLSAFSAFVSGERRPRMIFERMAAMIPPGCRYPPRIFASTRISELDEKSHFQCRYRYASDKRHLMGELDTWSASRKFQSFDVMLGSALPAFRGRYEATTVLRGLTKIAINLLRQYCVKTVVSREEFLHPIRVVMGEVPVHPMMLCVNGFVRAQDIGPLECPNGSHRVRILYDKIRRFWRFYFSFFGGRIGACVRFPGPCAEDWCTAEITAPLGRAPWSIRTSPIFQELPVRVEWTDLSKMVPSIPFVNLESKVTVSSNHR